jgi:deazaflavin-dependent oxidoreductase (nitroreductase family)
MSKRFEIVRKFNRAIMNPVMKWLVAGRFFNYSLLYHVGRRSGKKYATPVEAVKKDAQIYIFLPYGTDTDWVLNVQKAGQCQVKIKGKTYLANCPELVGTEGTASAFTLGFLAKIKKTNISQCLRLKIAGD